MAASLLERRARIALSKKDLGQLATLHRQMLGLTGFWSILGKVLLGAVCVVVGLFLAGVAAFMAMGVPAGAAVALMVLPAR